MPELAADEPAGWAWDVAMTQVLAAHQRSIAHHTAALQATVAQLLQRAGADGERYVADEVALGLTLSPGQAKGLVGEAQLMSCCPQVWALMSDGTLSALHARAISSQLAVLALSDPADVERVLDLVVPKVQGLTPHQLAQLVDAACLTLDIEVAEKRRAKTRADRDVTSYPSGDSGATLYAHGPVERIAEMIASLDSLTWPRHPDDTRTAAQRRFDTLHQLVCGGLQPGQWEAQVVVTLQSLLGTSEELAEIPGLGKVLPSVARDLLAHAGLRRLVVDEPTGALLDVDDRCYRPPVTRPAATSQRRPTADPEPPMYDDQVEHPLDPTDLSWSHQATTGAAPTLRQHDQMDQDTAEPDGPVADGPAAEDTATADIAADDDELVDPIDLLPTYEQDRQREAEHRRDRQWASRQGIPLAKAQLLTSDADWPTLDEVPSWNPEALTTALSRLATDGYQPRDLSSAEYTPPRRLKRFLVIRDRSCVFPGCRRSALHADKDHLVPWPRGATTADNLASECPHHHRAKHHHFTVTRLSTGGLRWRTPAGLAYDVPPRTLLR